MPTILVSLMQMVFFVTPILWNIKLLPEYAQKLMIFNPFTVFLSICREPLLGTIPTLEYWLAAFLFTAIAWIVALPLFITFRSRILYWL